VPQQFKYTSLNRQQAWLHCWDYKFTIWRSRGPDVGSLDRSRYFLFQVAPQLYSRGWVNPVSDPLLLRKSSSAGNLTPDLWICSQELWPLDHRGGHSIKTNFKNAFTWNWSTQFPVFSAYVDIWQWRGKQPCNRTPDNASFQWSRVVTKSLNLMGSKIFWQFHQLHIHFHLGLSPIPRTLRFSNCDLLVTMATEAVCRKEDQVGRKGRDLPRTKYGNYI
jgi:hypothetical protein